MILVAVLYWSLLLLPTEEDNVVIFFYRGTIGQDSFIFDVKENVKVGDDLKINKSTDVEFNRVPQDSRSGSQERERIVTRIDSAATLETPSIRVLALVMMYLNQ